MSANERIQRAAWIERSAKLARTYLRKAAAGLAERPPLSVYWDLLHEALDVSVDIIEALPDDFFEEYVSEDIFGLGGGQMEFNMSDETFEKAEAVLAALIARREGGKLNKRIAALENVVGRTPEEAAVYLAKAQELRSKRTG